MTDASRLGRVIAEVQLSGSPLMPQGDIRSFEDESYRLTLQACVVTDTIAVPQDTRATKVLLGLSFAKDFLASEKAPYIVTLFIAALSWTAVRTADRLLETQFLEYHVGPSKLSTGAGSTELRLRNLTSSARFGCFVLTVATRAGQSLKFGDAKFQEHRVRGTVLAQLTAKRSKDNEWVIEAANFAPGADVALFIPSVGEGSPLVLVQPCAGKVDSVEFNQVNNGQEEKDGDKPKVPPPPVLVEQGVRTVLVEHELSILWAALALWLLTMLVISRSPKAPTATPTLDCVQAGEAKHDTQGTLD